MKIVTPWENDGFRLLISIESKSLTTHSKMQSLTDEDTREIHELSKDVLARLTELLKGK